MVVRVLKNVLRDSDFTAASSFFYVSAIEAASVKFG